MARLDFGARVVACVLLSCGCESPATQLVVLVDSDFDVPAELARVHVRVLDEADAEMSSHEFALAGEGVDPGPARFVLPLSFAVVPRGQDADRRVAIEVDGLGPDDEEVIVRRRAVTGFIEEERLLLPLFLARSCAGVACPSGQTCAAGSCVDEEVPPGSLPVVRPGGELLYDGGGSSPVDAAAPCEEAVSCDGGSCGCATECCTLACGDVCTPSCQHETCHVSAAGSSSVDVSCGVMSECHVDAREAGTVTVDCMLSRCEVDCQGAERCDVTCGVNAQCIVRCEGAGECTINGCSGSLAICGDEVQACRTDCP